MEHRIPLSARLLAITLALFALVPGCAKDQKPRPLTPSAFNAQGPRSDKLVPMDPLSRADQSGVMVNNARVGTGVNARVGEPPGSRAPARVEGLSQIVQNEIRPPGFEDVDLTTQPASSRPSALQPASTGPSSGQYYEIGGVVADVNGTPIYAGQVIKLAEPILSTRAKALDEPQFRLLAQRVIKDAMTALVSNQLEYVAAEQALEQNDKDLAEALTARWRQEQITAAGGSLAVARQRSAARGEDFDARVTERYRYVMSGIYYEKNIRSKIIIPAADIRAYYNIHRDREFTDLGSARFRLIKLDSAKHGGREATARFAGELRNRIANAGESFESIARSVNDDPRWLKSGGDLGTAIQERAFAITAVEKAVWETPVGGVTPVIDAGNAFYIAKVEQKTPGKVHSFEEEAVQSKIDYELSTEQFRNARDKRIKNLEERAAIRSTDAMKNTALEMAMQNYARWAGK